MSDRVPPLRVDGVLQAGLSAPRQPPSGRRQIFAVAVLSLVAAVLVAACGGSAYTKADFVARADAICASAVRQIRAIGPQGGVTQYVTAVLPVIDSEAAQLRGLRRPTESVRDQGTLQRYFAALNDVVQNYRQLAAAAKRGDTQGVASAEAALQASPVASLAASYGLRSCGTPGSTSA